MFTFCANSQTRTDATVYPVMGLSAGLALPCGSRQDAHGYANHGIAQAAGAGFKGETNQS